MAAAKKKMGLPMQGSGRQTAKAVLEDQVKRSKDNTDTLETLLRIIPWGNLCQEDEEKLWNYFWRID